MEKVKTAFVTTRVERVTGFVTIGVCFKGEVLSEEQVATLSLNLQQRTWGELSKIKIVIDKGSSFIWIEIQQAMCHNTIANMARNFGQVLKKTGLTKSVMTSHLWVRWGAKHSRPPDHPASEAGFVFYLENLFL